MLLCVELYSAIINSIVLLRMKLCSIALNYRTVLYCCTWNSTVLYTSIMLYETAQHCINRIVLCYLV